jgi:glycosyltransferase involved in cell wall biosynthesis
MLNVDNQRSSNDPYVTIVVTVLNSADTMRDCLQSLIDIRHKKKNILVVDAFSTDGTWEILQDFKKRFPSIIQLHQMKGPCPVGWNYGINNTNTEYIAFTDADCEVDPGWIAELLKGFKTEGVIAVAGFCGTAKTDSWFQKVVGMELENRFKNFPRFLDRAPTMNLCVKTEYCKKVMFDEKLITSSEVDFGWRLTRLGKMLYSPDARIVHHHRTTWKGFWKQQRNYAKYLFIIYFTRGYGMKSDHISTPKMILQVPILELAILSIPAVFFSWYFALVSLFSVLALTGIYLSDFFHQRMFFRYVLHFIAVSFVRNLAWMVGSIQGMLNVITKKGI